MNADIYLNGDVYNSLSDQQKKAIEVAANASLMKAISYRIIENGKALKDLTDNHGVILHDTHLLITFQPTWKQQGFTGKECCRK